MNLAVELRGACTCTDTQILRVLAYTDTCNYQTPRKPAYLQSQVYASFSHTQTHRIRQICPYRNTATTPIHHRQSHNFNCNRVIPIAHLNLNQIITVPQRPPEFMFYLSGQGFCSHEDKMTPK